MKNPIIQPDEYLMVITRYTDKNGNVRNETVPVETGIAYTEADLVEVLSNNEDASAFYRFSENGYKDITDIVVEAWLEDAMHKGWEPEEIGRMGFLLIDEHLALEFYKEHESQFEEPWGSPADRNPSMAKGWRRA